MNTPRTDKVIKKMSGLCRSANAANGMTDLARELERENARLREALTNCARTLRTHREDGVSITGTEDGDIDAAEFLLLPNT